jgi:hypothetical protein
MKRIAAISSNVAEQMARTCEKEPQIITVEMKYETPVNEFIRMNKEAHKKTAGSRLQFR